MQSQLNNQKQSEREAAVDYLFQVLRKCIIAAHYG